MENEGRQWKAIADQLRDVKKEFRRRRVEAGIEEAAEVEDVPLEAMIEREPVTIVCSQDGLDPRHDRPHRP